MSFFEDLTLVYNKAIKKTLKNIKNNPVILLGPIFYGALYQIAINIFSIFIAPTLGVLSGFLLPIVSSMILSSYFSMLSDVIYYNRISFNNFTRSFTDYFSSIYSVYFILIIISWITPMLGNLPVAHLFISVILVVLFNPIAEEIYIGGNTYTQAYSKCLEFLKENAFLWMLPFILYLLITQVMGFSIAQGLIMSNVIDIPLGNFQMSPLMGTSNIKAIIALLLTGVYAIFRGNLFTILNNSTRRKRAYMGEYYDDWRKTRKRN